MALHFFTISFLRPTVITRFRWTVRRSTIISRALHLPRRQEGVSMLDGRLFEPFFSLDPSPSDRDAQYLPFGGLGWMTCQVR